MSKKIKKKINLVPFCSLPHQLEREETNKQNRKVKSKKKKRKRGRKKLKLKLLKKIPSKTLNPRSHLSLSHSPNSNGFLSSKRDLHSSNLSLFPSSPKLSKKRPSVIGSMLEFVFQSNGFSEDQGGWSWRRREQCYQSHDR